MHTRYIRYLNYHINVPGEKRDLTCTGPKHAKHVVKFIMRMHLLCQDGKNEPRLCAINLHNANAWYNFCFKCSYLYREIPVARGRCYWRFSNKITQFTRCQMKRNLLSWGEYIEQTRSWNSVDASMGDRSRIVAVLTVALTVLSAAFYFRDKDWRFRFEFGETREKYRVCERVLARSWIPFFCSLKTRWKGFNPFPPVRTRRLKRKDKKVKKKRNV